MRKPTFYICENKGADQLRGTVLLISAFVFAKYIVPSLHFLNLKISSLKSASVAVQPGLCRTWSETPKTGFLMTRLKYQCSLDRLESVLRHYKRNKMTFVSSEDSDLNAFPKSDNSSLSFTMKILIRLSDYQADLSFILAHSLFCYDFVSVAYIIYYFYFLLVGCFVKLALIARCFKNKLFCMLLLVSCCHDNHMYNLYICK